MGLSTGAGTCYKHVLICTWFFSNWPCVSAGWGSFPLVSLPAPPPLEEEIMSSFETDFCGLIADGVGPTCSSAHPPARSFELRDRCVGKCCFSPKGIVDGSMSSLLCHAQIGDVFVAVHFCLHALASQISIGISEDSFCGNGSIACYCLSGFYSPITRGNGHLCRTTATTMLHQRKRSFILLFHDDDDELAGDYDMWCSDAILDEAHCRCSLFSHFYILVGDSEPYFGSTPKSVVVFSGCIESFQVDLFYLNGSLPTLQPRTCDVSVFRAKSDLGGLSCATCLGCTRVLVLDYFVSSCSTFLLSASPSVRSVAFELAILTFFWS